MGETATVRIQETKQAPNGEMTRTPQLRLATRTGTGTAASTRVPLPLERMVAALPLPHEKSLEVGGTPFLLGNTRSLDMRQSKTCSTSPTRTRLQMRAALPLGAVFAAAHRGRQLGTPLAAAARKERLMLRLEEGVPPSQGQVPGAPTRC